MSSNFLQFNPGAVNQETDSVYLADAQRVGGTINGQVFNDQLANKLFYQLTTFVTALSNSLSNKGYSLSDVDVNALQSVLANVVTFNDLRGNLSNVAFSSTPAFNASNTNGFDFILAGNVTSSTLTGAQLGQIFTFVITQGATTFTFSPPPNINGWVPINPVPNSVTTQSFIVKLNGTIWPITSQVQLLMTSIASISAQLATINSQIAPVVTPGAAGSILVSNGTVLVSKLLTLHDQTGLRSLSTVYQNLSGADMRVSGSATTSGSSTGNLACNIGPTSSPTSVVYKNQSTATVSGGDAGFTFTVPVNYYYQVVTTGAITVIGKWFEYTYD